MAVTPASLVASGVVVVGTNAMAVIGAEFSGDPLESDGGLELRDVVLKFSCLVASRLLRPPPVSGLLRSLTEGISAFSSPGSFLILLCCAA